MVILFDDGHGTCQGSKWSDDARTRVFENCGNIESDERFILDDKDCKAFERQGIVRHDELLFYYQEIGKLSQPFVNAPNP